MSPRQQQITQWLNQQFTDYQLSLVSGDASFRRYFRVTVATSQYILMDAPPELEDILPFIDISDRLLKCGVNAPRIIAQDTKQGFLLLEDFADIQYQSVLNDDTATQLYRDAIEALVTIQHQADTSNLPLYDEAMLKREMALFPNWLVETHLGISLSQSEKDMLENCFDFLAKVALEQPVTFVHRDYHSRNLMYLKENNPGILDFQDAVIGPITYDVVSLLKDCYIKWPRQQTIEWLESYSNIAIQREIIKPHEKSELVKWFDLMGVQRHLKAAGIFARLNCRDNKPAYLNDIPRTLSYIVDIKEYYPQLRLLADFIESTVIPKL